MRTIGNFGIPFLDKHLTGLMLGDLIMVGSPTGGGKSSLADLIAQNLSIQRIPTVLLSLENAKGDFFSRSVYREYKRLNPDCRLSWREWMPKYAEGKYHDLEEEVQKINGLLIEDIGEAALDVVESDSNIKDLESLLKAVSEYVDYGKKVIIIDHIDHVATSVGHDLQFIRDAMRSLADIAFNKNVCIITFSQIRKDIPAQCMIPSLYDIRGGSAKVDVATVVVTMARFAFFDDKESGIFSSLMAIRKDRYGHLAMGRLQWKDGRYLPFYKEIHDFDDRGYLVEGLSKEKWAKATRSMEIEHETSDTKR